MFPEFTRRQWTPEDDISPEQTEYATSLRIPLLATSQPRWFYITGIVVGDTLLEEGVMPDENELAAIAERLEEYCSHWYLQSFREAMMGFAPYDIDGGANLAYFIKHCNGGWAYRKRTWCIGPYWMPQRDDPPLSLQQVLDRTRSLRSSTKTS